MYLKWKTKTITDLFDKNINSLYDDGYLFARTGKGDMYQTRSLRINLDNFKLSSENKRILRKTEDVRTDIHTLPYSQYHWLIHKLGKDFYTTKFGDKTFSANKIKELMTNKNKSNFNIVFVYSLNEQTLGYCIASQTNKIIHYCYPFYDLENSPKNMGMGMMLKAIIYARDNKKKYIYLGSFSRPGDTYKVQFSGLEWFNKKNWQSDLKQLKNTLKNER